MSSADQMMSEGQYHQSWCRQMSVLKSSGSPLTPTAIAVAGGQVTTQVCWLFVAGYQAALAHILMAAGRTPDLTGWGALLVSEDRSEDARPGVTTVRDTRGTFLQGYKSWVAASRSLDWAIVKAGRGDSAAYCHLPISKEGIVLSHSPSPRVLPDLSQGRAEFKGVRLQAGDMIPPSALTHFGTLEGLYVVIALLASCAEREGFDPKVLSEQIAIAAELAAQPKPDDEVWVSTRSRLSSQIEQVLDEIASNLQATEETWQRDQGLLRRYAGHS